MVVGGRRLKQLIRGTDWNIRIANEYGQGCIQKFCQGGGQGKFGVRTKEGRGAYELLHPYLLGGGHMPLPADPSPPEIQP